MDQVSCSVELLVGQADVRVAPEALRKDPRRFDGRRVVQITHDETRLDRKAPRPALARRVVLRIADDVDNTEHALPHGRVEDRLVAALNGRPLRGRVPADLPRIDVRGERPLAAPANEEPARQMRSITPAIAMPKPTHMQPMP